MNWTQTLRVIPNGVQTESKMPSRHVEGVYPKYIDKGDGAYIWSGDKKYIDYPCGLGAILLGHNHTEVNSAVFGQMQKGLLFPLPHWKETQLAEKLVDIVPSYEMVRFVKTGSEACSAAVKIARCYTERDIVLCCGYHGWHDWYNVTTDKCAGVPRQMGTFNFQFQYNDIKEATKLFDKYKHRIAAVIMEPYILDPPKDDFLKKIRKLCTSNESLLIFDEVVTGMRTPGYTAQKYFGVMPDLTTLGKALGNGFPIGVVGGKKEVMEVLEEKCFISSTFGGELASVSAALAVLDFIEKDGTIAKIETYGQQMKQWFNSKSNDDCECIGYPCRTFFKFPTEDMKSLFWQECLREGVFFGYAQFISGAHGRRELDDTLAAISRGLYMCNKYKDNPKDGLKGVPAGSTNRLQEKENETKTIDIKKPASSEVVEEPRIKHTTHPVSTYKFDAGKLLQGSDKQSADPT